MDEFPASLALDQHNAELIRQYDEQATIECENWRLEKLSGELSRRDINRTSMDVQFEFWASDFIEFVARIAASGDCQHRLGQIREALSDVNENLVEEACRVYELALQPDAETLQQLLRRIVGRADGIRVIEEDVIRRRIPQFLLNGPLLTPKDTGGREDEQTRAAVPDGARGATKPYLGIRLDERHREVTRDGYEVRCRLTGREWEAMHLLLAAEGAVVPETEFVRPAYCGSTKGSALRNVLSSLGTKLFPLDLGASGERKLVTVR